MIDLLLEPRLLNTPSELAGLAGVLALTQRRFGDVIFVLTILTIEQLGRDHDGRARPER